MYFLVQFSLYTLHLEGKSILLSKPWCFPHTPYSTKYMVVTPATAVSLPSQLDFSSHSMLCLFVVSLSRHLSCHPTVFSERNSGGFVMEFSQRQEKAGSQLRLALSACPGILPAAGVCPFSRPAKHGR